MIGPETVIGSRFQVEREVARGGMAVVYRALDLQTGFPAAVKVMREDLGSRERMVLEAQVLSGLSHPGVVRYLHHGTVEQSLYLAMEWLEGKTLASLLGAGALEQGQALELCRRAAMALAAAHAAGVVHRDVKPDNLFLEASDPSRVKVLDFGVARREESSDLTLVGSMIGTPTYMSPEQVRGDGDLDARTDIYSLGCVLFEALCGQAPYEAAHAIGVLAKVLIEPVPHLSERIEIAPEIDRLVAAMLSKDRSHRPESMAALVVELEALSPKTGVAHRHPVRPAPRTLTAAELRVLSVVLVGRPGMGNERTLSPSESAAREQRLRTAVMLLGGRYEPMVGGSILVSTSGSGTAGELATAAARCALTLRGMLPRARAALCTGTAMMNMGAPPAGEAIDRAVALLDSCPPGEVALDSASVALLESKFELLDSEGRASVPEGAGRKGSALLGPPRDSAMSARTFLRRRTPCVGRDRELRDLAAIFDEVSSEPIARAVLVTAPAGGGKSRLRHEFLLGLQRRGVPVELLVSRAEPLAQGSPLGLIGPALRRSAGILDGETIETSRVKLRVRLERVLSGADVGRCLEFLGELVGARVENAESSQALRAARRDPFLMADQMRTTWEAWLAAECAVHPVVLVLEDLHWGDLASVQFIDSALRSLREAPLMVLALARPEVSERFPALWREREVQRINLASLTRKSSERLARQALGDGVDEATLHQIIERAAGNPFFLEELVRSVVEQSAQRLPDTILAVLQGRLDDLGTDARRLLRAASLFGETFWRGAAGRLTGVSDPTLLDAELDALCEKELIARRPVSAVAGEVEFVFRHALLRDAVYAMLTEADRTLGHRLAGRWLEEAGAADPRVLAEHLDRGGEAERASEWYLRAADKALEANDFNAALAMAEKGEKLGKAQSTQAASALVQSVVLGWRGEFERAKRAGERAMGGLAQGSSSWYRALAEVLNAAGILSDEATLERWATLAVGQDLELDAFEDFIPCLCRGAISVMSAGRRDIARQLSECVEMLAVAKGLGGQSVGWIHRLRAMNALYAGDPAESLGAVEVSCRAFDEAGDVRNACFHQMGRGYLMGELGAFGEAERVLREVVITSERLGLDRLVTHTQHNLGNILALGFPNQRERLREALEIEERAAVAFATQGDRRLEATSFAYVSNIQLLLGDGPAAEKAALRAVATAPHANARCFGLSILAQALLAQERVPEAVGLAAEAVELLDRAGGIDEGESLVRLISAKCLHASGRVDEATMGIDRAAARVVERSMRIKDPRWRESFLTRAAHNAETLALAQAWTRSPRA